MDSEGGRMGLLAIAFAAVYLLWGSTFPGIAPDGKSGRFPRPWTREGPALRARSRFR
jgi:hypothetical protein